LKLLSSLLLLAFISPCFADEFELKEGDRVVLLGSTMIEREQRYGYWETSLTIRYPNRNISFRNLGWSGDNVFGEARAAFGTIADGFKQLKELTLELKPTVILICYGTNESFEGQAGLAKFIKGYETLLDAIKPTKARITLLSPMPLEDLGKPLPDPTKQNENLRLYRDAIRQLAEKRKLPFGDLFALMGEGKEAKRIPRLTDNGMHLTAFGYWTTIEQFEKAFDLKPQSISIRLPKEGKVQSTGTKVTVRVTAGFDVLDDYLPNPLPPVNLAANESRGRTLQIEGLAAGNHTLMIDGKEIVTTSAEEWEKGVVLLKGPEIDQVQKLRQTIRDKNELYFYRWRPQNETYLFGFRKHEQGKNAKEIAEFDPLVGEKEKLIWELNKPTKHHYEIVPVR
jgi:lysophospholipase L1-like esterase